MPSKSEVEDRKEQHRERQRRYRARQRDASRDGHSDATRDGAVTLPHNMTSNDDLLLSSEVTNEGYPQAGVDDERIRKAARLIAQRRLTQRSDVNDPGAWIASVTRRLASGEHPELRESADAHPDADAEQLADLVGPPDTRRKSRPVCDACQGSGWTFNGDEAVACNHGAAAA